MIMSSRVLVLLLWFSFLPSLRAQVKNPSDTNVKKTAPETVDSQNVPLYVIQPNDMLEIFVWKEPELTRKVLVRPDGRISLPLVQDLPAAGISPGELKVRIEQKLSEFIESPSVTVIVDAIQSYRIYVTGKVQKPGGITVEKPITVLQALTMAGGFQDYAKDDEMTVIRNYGNENIVLKFNYKDVIQGKNPQQNIFLRSGDVVVVP
jgi:polysaccharide export outer membrane protein